MTLWISKRTLWKITNTCNNSTCSNSQLSRLFQKLNKCQNYKHVKYKNDCFLCTNRLNKKIKKSIIL